MILLAPYLWLTYYILKSRFPTFFRDILTLIYLRGLRNTPRYILFYNFLVTYPNSWNLVDVSKIYLGLIFWIFFTKIRTRFCIVSTFSQPVVIFLCMFSVCHQESHMVLVTNFERSYVIPHSCKVSKPGLNWS